MINPINSASLRVVFLIDWSLGIRKKNITICKVLVKISYVQDVLQQKWVSEGLMANY